MVAIDRLLAKKDAKGLIHELNSRNYTICRDAAKAISFLAKKGVFFINEVQSNERLLFDAYIRVRYNAAYALGYLAMHGHYDKSTLFLLISLLSDRNSLVRANSAFALGWLAREDICEVSSVKPLISLLSVRNYLVRKKAAEALKELKVAGVWDNNEGPHVTIIDSVIQRTNFDFSDDN